VILLPLPFLQEESFMNNTVPSFGRRQFLKILGAGAAALSATAMGLSTAAAQVPAAVRPYKLLRAKETRNNCTYCSVGCGILMYSMGDGSKNAKPRIFHIEGDPDHPVSRGSLCPKGAGLLDMIHSKNRLLHPEYRAPGSKEWVKISWEDATRRIARLLKDDRDANFIARNEKGQVVNRWLSSGFLASSAASNETGLLDFKFTRALGMLGIDCQARLCHAPTVSALAPQLWARCHDQSLGGHQERQRGDRDGRQSRRSPPGRFQMGDRGQDQEQGQGHCGGPAL